jgi:ubiquitin-protein ligase
MVENFASHKFSKDRVGTVDKARRKRLMSEFVSMKDSLPLDKHGAVFLRWSESQMHLMKALIVAPSDTPYGGGCFVFDIAIPDTYPNAPPKCEIVTTGGGRHRFNPNLYAEGKVCLSLLGTWEGEPWDSKTSTLHQVLLSIYGLIFVDAPYFNEPGYQNSMGTPTGDAANRAYNEFQQAKTVEIAMLDSLKNPPKAFEDVVRKHFWLRRDDITERIDKWQKGMKGDSVKFAESGVAVKAADFKKSIDAFTKLIKEA